MLVKIPPIGDRGIAGLAPLHQTAISHDVIRAQLDLVARCIRGQNHVNFEKSLHWFAWFVHGELLDPFSNFLQTFSTELQTF